MKIDRSQLKVLPPLYSQKRNTDPILYVKLIAPKFAITWYAAEGSTDDEDFQIYAFVEGDSGGSGYFMLSDLERFEAVVDTSFQPRSLSQVFQAAA